MTYGPNHWHVKLISSVMPQLLEKIKGQYDLLIVLSHLGLTMDRWLARHYPQITLIVGGHSHTYLPNGEKVGQTWIAQTGKWGEHIGDIHLELDDHHHLKHATLKTVETARLSVSPEDAAVVSHYHQKGQDLLNQGKVAFLPIRFANDKRAAIDISLDAMADFAQTKLAILNSGLFLSPFGHGIVTKYDLQKALPHPMHVVRTKLNGSDLWRLIMEMEKNRHYLEHFPLKGMSFRGKVFGQIYYKGITVDPAHRLVYIDGQEIDPQKRYEVAVLDHHVLVPFFPTLAIMGDNTFLFPKFLREVVAAYLAKKYPLSQLKGKELRDES